MSNFTGRRHNNSHNRGTINQDIKASNPKWEDIGGGILKLKGHGTKFSAYIRRKGSIFASVKMKDVLAQESREPNNQD